MKAVRKLTSLLSLFAVLFLATIAGLFLAACRHVRPQAPGSATGSAAPSGSAGTTTGSSAATAASTGSLPPPGRPSSSAKTVDVDETEQGQPIPRNLLE